MFHKYDTTVSEILVRSEVRLQSALDKLIAWSDSNYMNINCNKTKEMILGPLSKQLPSSLLILDHNVEQASSYKLLGVVSSVNNSLKWDDHVTAVKSKAAKRLWFLKKLKRAEESQTDLVYFYQAVIRPALE